MKQMLAEMILPLADAMYNAVNSVPLGIVRAFVFAVFGALAIWILFMPPQLPESESGKRFSFLSDLRFFALAVLALQSLLYVLF